MLTVVSSIYVLMGLMFFSLAVYRGTRHEMPLFFTFGILSGVIQIIGIIATAFFAKEEDSIVAHVFLGGFIAMLVCTGVVLLFTKRRPLKNSPNSQ